MVGSVLEYCLGGYIREFYVQEKTPIWGLYLKQNTILLFEHYSYFDWFCNVFNHNFAC